MFKELAKLLDDVSQNKFPFWHLRWKFAKAIEKLNILDPIATEVIDYVLCLVACAMGSSFWMFHIGTRDAMYL